MQKRLKLRTKMGLVFVLVLMASLLVLARLPWTWELSCDVLRRELPRHLKMDVSIEQCEIDPLTQSFSVKGVRMASHEAQRLVLTAKEASVSVRALLFGRWGLHLSSVALQSPQLRVDLSTTSTSSGASDVCAAKWVERLPIDRLDLTNGEVELLLPEEQRVQIKGLEIHSELQRGTHNLRMWSRDGSWKVGAEREVLLGRMLVEMGFHVRDRSLELHRGEWVADRAQLQLSGQMEDVCAPAFSLESRVFLPMSTLAKVSGMTQSVAGHLWARMALTGDVEKPVALVDVRGASIEVGPYAPGDFSARLLWKEGVLKLDEFSAAAGKGRVKVSGNLQLTKHGPLSAEVELKDAQFGEVMRKASVPGSWVDFGASGHASLSGSLSPFRLKGSVNIDARQFVLAARGYDEPVAAGRDILRLAEVNVKTDIEIAADSTTFDNAELTSQQSQLRGKVRLAHHAPAGIDAELTGAPLDLGEFGSIAGLSWAGRGPARFSIHGPFSDVVADAQLTLRDAEFWDLSLGVLQTQVHYEDKVLSLPSPVGQKGQSPYSGQVTVDFRDHVHSDIQLDMPSGRVDDLIDLMVKLHPSIEVFQGVSKGKASLAVRLAGPSGNLDGFIRTQLQDLSLYDRALGSGTLNLRFVKGESLLLDKTVMQGGLGALSLGGSWSFGGPLDFRFRLDRASLVDVLGSSLASDAGIAGTVTWVGKVSGDSSMPQIASYLTSPNISFASRSLGPAQMEMRLLGRDLQVWGTPFSDARTNFSINLRAPYAYQLNLKLALPEIRPLLPNGAMSQGVSGTLSGTLKASGEMRRAAQSLVDAHIDRLTLARGDFSGRNEGPIDIHYAQGKWEFPFFVFRGSNTEVSASGVWGPKEVDLKATGTLDVRLLETFLPQIEKTAGRVDLSLAIGGTTQEPSLVGSADAKDVRLALKSVPLTGSSMNGRIEFSESRVALQNFTGVLNDGPFSMRGDLRLKRMAVDRLDVALDFDQVQVRPVESMPMITRGELLLQGSMKEMFLRGRTEVLSMHYTQPLALDGLLRDVKKAPSFVRMNQSSEWLRFDVDVALGEDVWVDNNLAQTRLKGNVKLTGTNLRPGLLGRIEAEEGSRAYYRGNAFVVSKGELQFKDANSIDLFIDLNAQTQVREFQVSLKSFGRASDPKVLLSSDPALPEGDILTLLTLGLTSRDTAITDRAVSGFGLAAEALLTASGFDRRVQSFLPKNSLMRDLQMHMTTTYNSATRQVEPAWIIESKLFILGEQLKLSMVQPVASFSGFRGYRALAEWRLTDRLSARAQWDNENQGYATGNPGLDLKMRFEWE